MAALNHSDGPSAAKPTSPPDPTDEIVKVPEDDASLEASHKGWVVCDHPGELRPRIPLRENCVEIVLDGRRSLHSDPPFLFGEGLFPDGFPEACSCEQFPDLLVVAAALQAADEVGCRPGLEAVQPRPRPGHIKRVRNEVLTAAGRPR